MAEYEFRINNDTTVIKVDKRGGGTLGKEYEGVWDVTVVDAGLVVFDETVTTGTPKSHHLVACMVHDWLIEE